MCEHSRWKEDKYGQKICHKREVLLGTYWEHIVNLLGTHWKIEKEPKKIPPKTLNSKDWTVHTLRRTFIYNTWANHWPINSTECEARVTIVWNGVCPCKPFTYFVKFLHGQTPFHTIVTLASSFKVAAASLLIQNVAWKELEKCISLF